MARDRALSASSTAVSGQDVASLILLKSRPPRIASFNTRLVQRPALIVIGVSRSRLNRDVDIVNPLSVPQLAPKQRDLLHSVQVVVVVVDAAHPLKGLCQFSLGSSSPQRPGGRGLCQGR